MPTIDPADYLIVALDVPDLESAARLVDELRPTVKWFKLGSELLMAIGAPAAVQVVKERGGQVFLDAKFHDIPATMAGAVKAASFWGVEMLTVHSSASWASLTAAVRNAGQAKVIGVTVLTSFSDAECMLNYRGSVAEKVPWFAAVAWAAGLQGVVCAARDLKILAAHPRVNSLLKIVPGIRPTWAARNDQERSSTPAEALALGADYLVVGRPITRPPVGIGRPAEAAKLVLDEMAVAGGGPGGGS